jgi:NAD(P)-dependent dehydrogenase (short-subunit alcohol dehydrogenase family)
MHDKESKMNENTNLVAVISGASRGIGKGIALALGKRGATVYVVGRTTISGTQVSAGGVPVPGSIHEVAEAVTAAGGRGIAVACDFAKDDEIRALFDQVGRESGHIDILVNNAASLHDQMGIRPFWEAPIGLADIINVGLRCHHVATYYAAPLLIARGRGLIVNISFYGNAKVHDPAYYAAKAGLDKLASVYAEDFTPYNVAAISLWPGYVKTERARMIIGDAPEMIEGMGMESPEFCGRVIGAIWDDVDMMALTGKTLIAAEAAERYNVADLPGHAPKSLRAFYGAPHPQFDLAP